MRRGKHLSNGAEEAEAGEMLGLDSAEEAEAEGHAEVEGHAVGQPS